jgi:SAM-dependent methyltransferase
MKNIIYNINKLLPLMLITFVSTAFASNDNLIDLFRKLPQSEWGVNSTIAAIDSLDELTTEPVLSSSGKSYLTVNKMGFDVLHTEQSRNSWLITEFLKFSKVAKNPVLDIGAGYGNISLMLLAQGNKVIANDLAIEHLLTIHKSAKISKLAQGNLYLNYAKFPGEMNFPDNSIDAVMLHRVIHFMSPAEIELGLSKIAKWLRPGGKIFIVVMAPQHKQFADWFLPIYNDKWQQGDKWPGVNLPVKKALPDQAYNLPEFLHVMDDRPLTLALENSGFKIEKKDFISMTHFAKKPNERDGKEAMGIIAVKK